MYEPTMGLKRVSTTISQHWTHSDHCLPSCVDPTVTAKVLNAYMLQTFNLFLIISIENAGQNVLDITNFFISIPHLHSSHDFINYFSGFQRLAQVVNYIPAGVFQEFLRSFSFSNPPAYTTRQWEVQRKSHRPSLEYRNGAILTFCPMKMLQLGCAFSWNQIS